MNNSVAKEKIVSLRKKRSLEDMRFKYYGFTAMCLSLAVLVFLLYTIFSKGYTAFQKTIVLLEVDYNQEVLKLTPDSSDEEMEKGKFFRVKKQAIENFFPDLSKSDIKLVLVGKQNVNGNSIVSNDIINFIKKRNLENDVVLTDHLIDSDVIGLYSNALFFVFPSSDEGFGIPVLESFSNDLPVK